MSDSLAQKRAALLARVATATGNSRGGLSVSLHPVLETQNATPEPSSKPQASKQIYNKYYDPNPADGQIKSREPRPLQFNPKGKYIQMANGIRKQAHMEEIKKRIAAATRQAGLDEVTADKNFVIEEPPNVEWFDQGYFVDGKTYSDLSDSSSLILDGDASIVTDLIQHPIRLEPPQDQLVSGTKPMYLTRKEQKKLRRQRRLAELKEQQAKIRLGLVPAPEPKVKKSNLMRVLGERAVNNPTAVEAEVNRQIEERHNNHIATNEERKLTKEQRHEKLAANQENDAAHGIHMLVFKIGTLANGQHRFKVYKNAEQHSLTGVCLVHPRINLVIVEGGQHSINEYRKLMMRRIDWTKAAPPTMKPTNSNNIRDWLVANADEMAQNKCELLFEGESKVRAFKKLSNKFCESDKEAYEFLSRHKLESFWTQARQS